MKRIEYINKITTYAARFVLEVQGFNAANKYDINIHSENFLIPILNEIFNLNLENLNQSKKFPAIDLGDFKNKVAFQITATADISKLETTLDKFFSNNLQRHFNTLYFYIITEKRGNYNDSKLTKFIPDSFNFKTKEHVFDKDILLQYINNISSTPKLHKLAKIYEYEFSDFQIELRNIEYIGSNINNRPNINSTIPINLEIISSETFDNEIIANKNTLDQLTLDFYLKFNNNQSNLKKVVANGIHITPNKIFNIRDESENNQLTLSDIISKGSIGQPVLVKITAVGGVGKTTLLWHFIKEQANNYKTFFLRRVDPNCIQYIFKELVKESQEAVLIFLDDAVSYEENRENLVRLGETISEFSSVAPIILVLSERFYRYDKFKSKKEFEKNFSSEFTIHYSNSSIRNEVFEKLFKSLNLNKELVSETQKNQCKRIFNQHEFDSLIDSAYNLIVYLKKDFPNINYRFDWEDWNEVCTGKFEILGELFKVVSFFYQFGIQVPIDFLIDYFNPVRNIKDLLRELLGKMQDKYSPIVLSVMANGKQGLSLRHEKMGEWYFQIIAGGKDSANDFFRDFLSNVKSKSASYLFRNLCRKNSEFQLSPYSKELPNQRILRVVESYLNQINERDYEEEEYKMLMEKHFILLNLGMDGQSNEPLEKTIQLKPDNVFALSRLAFCIQDTDFKRAEKLFKDVLQIENRSTYATIGLFKLYYDHQSLKQFDIFQEEIFSIAKLNLNFANILLQSIERHFIKLPTSTITHLHKLFEIYKVLGNDIAELFMKKSAYNDSYKVLFNLTNDGDLLSKRYRSKTLHLLIQLYKTQNNNDDSSLKAVEEYLRRYSSNEENDSETNLFYGKLLSLSRKTSSFRQAEKYFSLALEQDESARAFFEIMYFYREYATYIIGKEKNRLPKAITVYIKGINHLRSRLKTQITNKLPYEIELCIFLNEIVKAIFYHSSRLNDSSKKYLNLIESIENEAEKLLEKCLLELTTRLPKPSTELFSNYLVDEYDLQFHSKVCSVLYDFYSYRVKRINDQKKTSITTSYESLQYLTKVKEILTRSLEYNVDNSMLIINLIDIKITLKESDINLVVEKINFEKFTIKQKARLCRILIVRGYKAAGINLIQKFGQLNSTDIKVKNDLALCYIEAKLWSYAIKLFSDLRNANNYTLQILKRLALELPTNNKERSKAKIEISREYLMRSSIDIRIIKQNICKTYFVTGDKEMSYKYYKKNRFYIDNLSTNKLEEKIAFGKLCNKWQLELIDNLSKNISIAETIIDKQNRYEDGLDIVSETLGSVLSLKFNFGSINYNYKNEDTVKEKIKTIIIKSINILHVMIELNTTFSSSAFDLSFRIIKFFKNILFNKIFVSKLVKRRSKTLVYKCLPAIKHFEKNEVTDSDLIRMIGMCYLINSNYPQAKNLINISLNLAKDNKQLCYSYNNLADWIVTIIERDGDKNFSNENNIKKKLNEAEKHIMKSKELYPEFKYHQVLIGRLNILKQKYNY